MCSGVHGIVAQQVAAADGPGGPPLSSDDGSDAMRRAIGAANFHPLSVPALTRQAIKRLQRRYI